MTKEDHEFFVSRDRDGVETRSGKLLLLRPADTTRHHVFFDDNILETESYIVDTWDLDSRARVPFAAAAGVYLARVNLVHAICDPHYFVKKLAHCLRRRADSLGLSLAPAYREWVGPGGSETPPL